MIAQGKRVTLTRPVQSVILVIISLIPLCFFEEGLPGQEKGIDEAKHVEVKQLLQKQLKERELLIWYLSHCGYAVKTKSVLLIFDYWEKGRDGENGGDPQPYSLANGRINPEEIKELNVCVFVSHAHLDHYDQVIFEWENKVENISYIFGWQAKENPNYHYLAGPRSELRMGGMQVSTINETHDGLSGVCYLVKVDSLCLYFSGDYGWAMLDSYESDFEYLSAKAGSIDVAFLNPCYYEKDSNLMRLEIPSFFIQKFSPKIVFPQHYGGREELMAKLVGRSRKDFPLIKFESPKARGEIWHFDMN